MDKKETSIRFGTDGWRSIISEGFTFENVRKVAASVAAYSLKKEKNPKIIVGYDTRFLSKEFAKTIARILKSSGCETILSSVFISTPCLSSSVIDTKAFLGVMVSASHNPHQFNGIKIKTSQGCSAPEKVTAEIEKHLDEKHNKDTNGPISEADLIKGYLRNIKAFLDFNIIKTWKKKIIIDPMYGAGIGCVKNILKGTKVKCLEMHQEPDPVFGGIHPEPIESNLSDLKKAVIRNKAACGLATDGDADRLGVIDDRGRYLTPHQVFPLILYYLCKHKGLKGKIVQTISLGYISERIAKDFGLEFEEVPVGFKYIAEKILKEKILAGGEESGGYGFGDYVPERDGILNSMILIEILAYTEKNLSELITEIEKKYGKSRYLRTDFKNPGVKKEEFVRIIKEKTPSKMNGFKIKAIKDYDGIEFVLEDDSWLLMRPSGTEPVIRVYAESDEIKKTKSLIQWGAETVGSIL